MNYENVKLWFAKNKNGDIVTIDEIKEENKHDTYLCPVCGSELNPKALKSKQITSHFAHMDASKCSSESQIHFWFKNRFIEKGDSFTIVSDKEIAYIAKEVLIEQEYKTGEGVYRPDVTILTECGNTIYFEMAFSNKKKIKDYLDMWLELRNIVVEIDIKDLMNKNEVGKFKALFYDGKCFNTKRNDTYYNTIGKYKEEKLKGLVDDSTKERIKKLDWFWDDVARYNNDEIDIGNLITIIDSMNPEEKIVSYNIIKKLKCRNLGKYWERLKQEIREYGKLHYFANKINKDKNNEIIKAIEKLNAYFKSIDNGFQVYLDIRYKQYLGYARNYYGHKVRCWKTSSYYYYVILNHKLNNGYLYEEKVSNLISTMDSQNSIFDYYLNKFTVLDLQIKCAECEKYFVLNIDEINFFNKKKLSLPKRCICCRNKRKQNKLNTKGGN